MQIKAELDKVHGDTASTLKTVYFWIKDVQDVQDVQDEVEVTEPEMIEKIHRISMENRRLNVREIAMIVRISAP